MAGMYEGISGVARKIKSGYIGVSSVARKLKSGFVGVGGVARKFLNGELLVYDGSFQNGFSFDTGTGYASSTYIYDYYDENADGYLQFNVPSGFNAGNYSHLCLDMKFGTTSYEGNDVYNDNTDYAGYWINAYFPGYNAYSKYEVLDDNALNQFTIKLPIAVNTADFGCDFYFYTRCSRNSTYAATPKTYIYKMWFE